MPSSSTNHQHHTKKNMQHQQPTIYQVRKLIKGDEEFVGNSYWASNCDDCQEDVQIERDPITKFPLSYQCDKNPQWVTSSTMVQFDYEVAINATKSQHDNVLAMQWRFLEEVAERTGLSERCNFEYQFEDWTDIQPRNGGNGARRRRRRLNKSLHSPTTIYAIRSLPEDRAGSIGDCLSLSYDSETSECFPVTATMTVKYRGEPQDATFVQDYVKSVIQEALERDASKMFVQDVTGLEYLGERTHFTKPNAGITRIEAKQGWEVATMATLVSLSTLLCIMVAMLMMRKKKKDTLPKELHSPPNIRIQVENLPYALRGPAREDDDEEGDYDVGIDLMASTEDMELPPTPPRDHHRDDDYDNYDPHDPIYDHDLPEPPIQLQMPPIGRPLKVQRKKKQKGSSIHSRSSSFSTLLPISETNSENESESLGDYDENSEINLSFGTIDLHTPMSGVRDDDDGLHENYELIMDEIFL